MKEQGIDRILYCGCLYKLPVYYGFVFVVVKFAQNSDMPVKIRPHHWIFDDIVV